MLYKDLIECLKQIFVYTCWWKKYYFQFVWSVLNVVRDLAKTCGIIGCLLVAKEQIRKTYLYMWKEEQRLPLETMRWESRVRFNSEQDLIYCIDGNIDVLILPKFR